MKKMISTFKHNRLLQVFTIFLRYLLGGSFVHATILKIREISFTPESGKVDQLVFAKFF